MIKKLFLALSLIFLFVFLPTPTIAQTNPPEDMKFEGIITKIQEEKMIDSPGLSQKQLYQKLEITVTNKEKNGQTIIVENGSLPTANSIKYGIGDKVIVTQVQDYEGNTSLYISDYVRRTPLYVLYGLFVILTIVIGRWRGIASLLGMVLSFIIIFTFILPQILNGADPVMIAIIGSMGIIPITFYLSHGLNQKTTAAVIGTTATLIITGLLASFFVTATKLTGFASEEASFLQTVRPDFSNIRGLLLAGIIIGSLGILDDITISQAAIVHQLKKAKPTIHFKELFNQTMDIGHDHIASMVNTLILVYTGAALPLLLLFLNTPRPFTEIMNYEIIAEEIVRTLVGSIGLILAVPITTFITVLMVKKSKDFTRKS